MPVRWNMSLKGLDDYLEAVDQAGHDVDDAAERAVCAGGDVAEEGMQRRAPVGKPPKDKHPGLLRKTIRRSAPEREGNTVSVDVGVLRDAPAEVARYGNVQEFGSVHQPAQSYVRKTMDEDKRKVFAAERESLEEDGIL